MTQQKTAFSGNRISRRVLSHACLILVLVSVGGLLAPGCACRKRNVDRGERNVVRQGVNGNWTATLNPEGVPIDVPLTLSSQADGALSGSIAGVTIENGTASLRGEGSTIQFTTGTLTIQGAIDELSVEGPLEWSATLINGVLEGSVVGPDGRSDRWTARRP